MVRAIAGALGGGAIAFTLMACYGAAMPPPHPCPDQSPDCQNRMDAGATPTTPSVSSVDGGK